jgi:hypothetical protein
VVAAARPLPGAAPRRATKSDGLGANPLPRILKTRTRRAEFGGPARPSRRWREATRQVPRGRGGWRDGRAVRARVRARVRVVVVGGAVGGVERDGVVAARTEADLPGGAASAAQLAGGAGNEVAGGAAAGAAAVKACEAVTV